MLKELCELFGPSGCETEVSDFIKGQIREYCEIREDYMGNLICFKKGKKQRSKRVLLCAHMDEVGFIIVDITKDGYLKFDTVGGLDSRILLGQKVIIGSNRVNGVIGIKAIHLVRRDKADQLVELPDMYIDIGARSKEEAEQLISKGDYAVFSSEFRYFGDRKARGKAIDDRAGCAILIDLIRSELEYDTWFAFTVQEEAGLRGARVIAKQVQPDICMVVETTSCGDLPKVSPQKHNTTLGKGVAISNIDHASVSDIHLKEELISLCEADNIRYQMKRTVNGGNDAGAIFQSGGGVSTCTVSIPCRYIHSSGCVISLDDYKAVKSTAYAFVNRIGGEEI